MDVSLRAMLQSCCPQIVRHNTAQVIFCRLYIMNVHTLTQLYLDQTVLKQTPSADNRLAQSLHLQQFTQQKVFRPPTDDLLQVPVHHKW